MNNPEQSEFIENCKIALESGAFKKLTFASRSDKKFKAKFELVLGGKRKLVKYSDASTSNEETKALNTEEILANIATEPFSPFRAATLSTDEFDLHYSENRKQEPRLYKTKPSMKGVEQTHNRQKNYVLDKKRPYLKGLGVANAKGEIINKQYGKFRQIANFVEIIDRDIGEFVSNSDDAISILDLGCGKGYLTFATYDYVAAKAKQTPSAIGIDIKADVIELCDNLARNIGFDGLEFRNARIQPDKPQNVDILIALHACDTATDDALALGLRSNMQYFFCAPCCQAQIAQQTSAVENSFESINQFALMKRKQADIITDICRALLLTAMGYEVKFLEFTALEHTSKNIMLAGKRNKKVDRQKALRDYLALKVEYGFKIHALEENIKDLLPTYS